MHHTQPVITADSRVLTSVTLDNSDHLNPSPQDEINRHSRYLKSFECCIVCRGSFRMLTFAPDARSPPVLNKQIQISTTFLHTTTINLAGDPQEPRELKRDFWSFRISGFWMQYSLVFWMDCVLLKASGHTLRPVLDALMLLPCAARGKSDDRNCRPCWQASIWPRLVPCRS